MKTAKKLYRVNSSESFNVHSMYDHLKCIECQYFDGEIELTDSEYDDLENRIEEVSNLIHYAFVGQLVPWEILKRIREITAERRMIRYQRCLAGGMNEADAAGAFTD